MTTESLPLKAPARPHRYAAIREAVLTLGLFVLLPVLLIADTVIFARTDMSGRE
jgi:hypothetical protein